MSQPVFYAGVVEPHRPVRLLLGPFAERGLAVTALEPARDLDYLVAGAAASRVPTRVSVVSLRVPGGVTPPAGELNGAAVNLLPRLDREARSSAVSHRTASRPSRWLRRTR